MAAYPNIERYYSELSQRIVPTIRRKARGQAST